MTLNKKLRKRLYLLAAAIGGVLTVEGIISQDELAAYLAVATALLSVAFVHTPSGSDTE
jgi:urea transporter